MFYSLIDPERAKNIISFIKSAIILIPVATIIIISTATVIDGAEFLKPSKGMPEKSNGNNCRRVAAAAIKNKLVIIAIIFAR